MPSRLGGCDSAGLRGGGGRSPAGSRVHLGLAGSSEGLEMLWLHTGFPLTPRRTENEHWVPASEHVSMIHGYRHSVGSAGQQEGREG